MKQVKNILRRPTIGSVMAHISRDLSYEIGLEFDSISDLIYWSLIAPLMNNL